MLDDGSLRQAVRQELTPPRWAHTEGVVETAAQLACRFGIGAERARLAALLHDVARDWPLERMRRWVQECGWAIDPLEWSHRELLHGAAAACWAWKVAGIRDGEVLAAVRYHTTGRPEAGPLEMVLMVADFTEPGRTFAAAQRLREGLELPLQVAWEQLLKERLVWLVQQGLPIHPRTVAAWNWCRARNAGHGQADGGR